VVSGRYYLPAGKAVPGEGIRRFLLPGHETKDSSTRTGMIQQVTNIMANVSIK
jgi:hypothetical protein